MSYVIGIDPGLGGGFALLGPGGFAIIAVHSTPVTQTIKRGRTHREVDAMEVALSLSALRDFVADAELISVVIESVSARPGQGVTSMFNFGRGLGRLEGVAAALGLSVSYLTPATWRGRVGLRGDKTAARALASRLYPEQAHLFQRVKDDGLAEAVLIARAAFL